jgi:hypothetical protein
VNWTSERNSTATHNRERSHRRLIAASKDTLPQSETGRFQLTATLYVSVFVSLGMLVLELSVPTIAMWLAIRSCDAKKCSSVVAE